MRCNYPNCRNLQSLIPVIALPTVRTKGMTNEMVVTNRPTLLLGKEVCTDHARTYILSDWMNEKDWKHLQEAARANGYDIPNINIIRIEFKPLGWTPERSLELERTYGTVSVN